jgi:glycosyltransferase involved in cell wall biosynthesis
MHIAINATYRLHGAGLVHLTRLLETWSSKELEGEHRITLYTRMENIPLLKNAMNRTVRVHAVGAHSLTTAGKLVWEQFVLPRILRKTKANILLCLGNMAPLQSPVPTVVGFDNAAPFCTSVTFSSVGVHDWLWFKLLGLMMRLSARAASRVIFASQHLKDLFVRKFNFPSPRGDVIYHGRNLSNLEAPSPALLERLQMRRPYLLSISHLYPYKNMPALIEAYARARDIMQARGLQLALVGKPRSKIYERQLKDLIRERQLDSSIVLTGGVEHQVIAPLLSGCEFFVFQSTCENCPTTLIEALAAGLPIACSNAGVMPEIAGDAALYFDPFNPSDIAQALARLVEDAPLRDSLGRRALQQVAKFPTWDEVGQMTLKSLQRAVAEG